jgi:hypothetical protein
MRMDITPVFLARYAGARTSARRFRVWRIRKEIMAVTEILTTTERAIQPIPYSAAQGGWTDDTTVTMAKARKLSRVLEWNRVSRPSLCRTHKWKRCMQQWGNTVPNGESSKQRNGYRFQVHESISTFRAKKNDIRVAHPRWNWPSSYWYSPVDHTTGKWLGNPRSCPNHWSTGRQEWYYPSHKIWWKIQGLRSWWWHRAIALWPEQIIVNTRL